MKVLKAVLDSSAIPFVLEQHDFGARAIESSGSPLPSTTLQACLNSSAVLVGAIGDPRFTSATCVGHETPEQGLLRLRKEMNLYQNVRPVKVISSLIDSSPLKRERIAGADLVFLRELNSGIYNAFHDLKESAAIDHMVYTQGEIERITRSACEIARKRRRLVTCIGKANVLACSQVRLFCLTSSVAASDTVCSSYGNVSSPISSNASTLTSLCAMNSSTPPRCIY
jgi:3-isopropylmalate dehydrogenase